MNLSLRCLNYETIAFADVLPGFRSKLNRWPQVSAARHDLPASHWRVGLGERHMKLCGRFRLADFKRKRKFAGSFFSIFTPGPCPERH